MESCIDLVVYRVQKYMSYAYHPMTAEDRLGNKACNFPIAFCFGDKDIHGSEGADDIVKMNAHYESGRSQLFQVKNCGHNPFWDNPDELCREMIGFFEGTVLGTFELTPRRHNLNK